LIPDTKPEPATADVAIVVPSFNSERFVEQTIASALAQDHVLEVVVVDDGSTDRSATIVESISNRDPRVKLHRGPNRGSASARNVGYRSISPTSKFLLFLDADDVLAAGAISVLRRRLERDPTLAAAVGTRSRIDGAGTQIEAAPRSFPVYYADDRGVGKVEFTDRIGYWHVAPICPISTPGQCLLRVSDLPAGDLFDVRFAPSEDWELWLRLARRRDFGIEQHEVLSYRDHGGNQSKQYRLMQTQRARIYQAQFYVISSDERARARKAWRFGMFAFDARLCFDWARRAFAEGNLVGTARFMQRGFRYSAQYAWSVVRRAPDI